MPIPLSVMSAEMACGRRPMRVALRCGGEAARVICPVRKVPANDIIHKAIPILIDAVLVTGVKLTVPVHVFQSIDPDVPSQVFVWPKRAPVDDGDDNLGRARWQSTRHRTAACA